MGSSTFPTEADLRHLYGQIMVPVAMSLWGYSEKLFFVYVSSRVRMKEWPRSNEAMTTLSQAGPVSAGWPAPGLLPEGARIGHPACRITHA